MTDNILDKPKRPPIRPVPIILLLGAIATGAAVIYNIDLHPRTDDAEVFANFIGIAPLVEGPVVELYVRDNQFVKQGDRLYKIDDAPYLYALQNAKAEQAALEGQIANEQRHIASQESAALAAAAASRSAQANALSTAAAVNEARADVLHSEAIVKQSTAEYTYATNNLHRLEPLLPRQFVTVDQVDQARNFTEAKAEGVRQTEAGLQLSRARLASALAQQNQSEATVQESKAQILQSQHAINILDPLLAQRESRASAVRNAQYNYDHCLVYAPFDARVTNLIISPGAYAHVGQQLFTLIDTRVWWVIANFRETQLRNISPGMKADVYIMSNAEKRLAGVIDSAAFGVTPDPDVVGRLTPGLPDAQRTLNWVHLASRYPVRVRIEDPTNGLLRMGQSAVVIIRGK